MLNFQNMAWLLPIVALAAQPAAAEPRLSSRPAETTAASAAAKNEAPRPLPSARAHDPKAAATAETGNDRPRPLPSGRAAGPGEQTAAGAENYRPRPAIWLLEDEDTRIYMLGTIHMLPPGFHWRSPAIDRLVEEADELVVETYGEGDFMAEMALMLRPDPVPFLERLPEKHRAEVQAAIEESKIPLSTFDPMQTWAAAMLLGVWAVLESYGVGDPDEAPGVEDVLEAEFRKAGKPIGSIEDAGDVMRLLNAVPEEEQVRLLISGLEEETDLSADELIAASLEENHAWAQGRTETLADFADEMPEAMRVALLDKRNRAWADWLEKRLERPGTVLLAVGAAHLAGDVSVQKMLEARGLAARRFD